MPVLSRNKLEQRLVHMALTRRDLADAAGVSLRTIQNAIKGEAVSPTTHGAIARALKLKPATLVEKKTSQPEPATSQTWDDDTMQSLPAEMSVNGNGNGNGNRHSPEQACSSRAETDRCCSSEVVPIPMAALAVESDLVELIHVWPTLPLQKRTQILAIKDEFAARRLATG